MSSCPGRRERILPSGRGVGGAAPAACSSHPELDHARNLIVVGSGSARRPVRRAPPARRTVTALPMHLVARCPGTFTFDPGEDLVGCFGPDERVAAVVPAGDEGPDL